jgi:hypothetical protein
MYEFLLSDGRPPGEYKLCAHLMNHSNPRNLAEPSVSFEGVIALLQYLDRESHEMTFDDALGTVTKVAIDVAQKKVVLRVKLRGDMI